MMTFATPMVEPSVVMRSAVRVGFLCIVVWLQGCGIVVTRVIRS